MDKTLKLGVSAAASWAWGTSLIVGMQIARQKGLEAWAIWAIANSLTLAIFGELTRRGILGQHIFDWKWIKRLALVIQVICLVVQMNIINSVLLSMGMTQVCSYAIASGIGCLFTLLMYRKGLSTSIWTDCWQWGVTLVAICVILVMGSWYAVPMLSFPVSTQSDILWALWSACILIAGPIGDVQHWQRAEVAADSHAYSIGACFFAVYMLLIGCMARLDFNLPMNVVLLLAVLCVTSSTIDSIAVALHEISDKKAGTAVALFICLFWGVFASFGVLELWSRAGVYRVGFALLILALAIKYRTSKNDICQKTIYRCGSAD